MRSNVTELLGETIKVLLQTSWLGKCGGFRCIFTIAGQEAIFLADTRETVGAGKPLLTTGHEHVNQVSSLFLVDFIFYLLLFIMSNLREFPQLDDSIIIPHWCPSSIDSWTLVLHLVL